MYATIPLALLPREDFIFPVVGKRVGFIGLVSLLLNL
jgi:cell division protein FtsW (lipid II flippase)